MSVLASLVGAVVLISVFLYGLYKLVNSDRKPMRRKRSE